MLVLSFSETVNINTVDVAALAAQSKKEWYGATETHTFSPGWEKFGLFISYSMVSIDLRPTLLELWWA